MNKSIFHVIAVLIAFGAFANEASAVTVKSVKADKPTPVEVTIYESDATPQPYIIVGKINVEASTPKMLSNKIKSRAKKYGADAVLKYKMMEATTVSGWTGSTINNAEGIAVRWSQPGEAGLTAIGDKTPVPVLE